MPNSITYVRWTLCGINPRAYTDNAPSFWHRLQEEEMEKTCENCGTRLTLGCSWYRAEDCGDEMKEWTPECAKNTEQQLQPDSDQ